MFVIFSDSISNIIKVIEFRTGMDLIDEQNQVSERFSELFNNKMRTSRICVLVFSWTSLCQLHHLIGCSTGHWTWEGSCKSSSPTCSCTGVEMGPREMRFLLKVREELG